MEYPANYNIPALLCLIGRYFCSAYGLGWQTSLTREFPAGNRAKHLPLSSSFGWGGVTVVFTFPCPHRSGRYLVDGSAADGSPGWVPHTLGAGSLLSVSSILVSFCR